MNSQGLLSFVKIKAQRRNVEWGGPILRSNSDSGRAEQPQRGGNKDISTSLEISSNIGDQAPTRPRSPGGGTSGDTGTTTTRKPGESTMLESIPKLNIVILTGRVSADPQVS